MGVWESEGIEDRMNRTGGGLMGDDGGPEGVKARMRWTLVCALFASVVWEGHRGPIHLEEWGGTGELVDGAWRYVGGGGETGGRGGCGGCMLGVRGRVLHYCSTA